MLKSMTSNSPSSFQRKILHKISPREFSFKNWIKFFKKDDTVVFKDISRFTREAENGYKKYMSKREEIRKKLEKRIIENDIPFGVPDDGKVTRKLSKEDHQNIRDVKEQIMAKMKKDKYNADNQIR